MKSPTGSSSPSHRILVVDDEPSIADTLSIIFRGRGYTTATAYSGEEAIELARSFRPDFLLSDVRMPGMSGVEAAIKIVEFLPQCAVLFISGQAFTQEVLADANSCGLTFAVCSKPLAPVALLEKVAQMLASAPPQS